jgi:act minimal PKS chain-length factor (CLF/KS beta)
VVSALLSIRDGLLPPTVNVSLSPEYDIDLVVGQARNTRVGVALVLARGYGGFNSAMVIRRAS